MRFTALEQFKGAPCVWAESVRTAEAERRSGTWAISAEASRFGTKSLHSVEVAVDQLSIHDPRFCKSGHAAALATYPSPPRYFTLADGHKNDQSGPFVLLRVSSGFVSPRISIRMDKCDTDIGNHRA